MNYLALLRSSVFALTRNKVRSLLTVLGITIGIAAVICVVAIGKAGQNEVQRQLENLGNNLVWIESGSKNVNGVRTGTRAAPTLTMGDAMAIASQAPLITSVSPELDDPIQVIYGNQNWFTTYRGVSPAYFDIKRLSVDRGALFTQDDVEHAAEVCVLGSTVRDQLFARDENPIGKIIRFRGIPCKIVATLVTKGATISGQDQDDTFMVPYTTAQKKLKGVVWIDAIFASALSPDAVKPAGQQAAAILRDRHRLRPGVEDDFTVRNPEDIIQAQLESSRTLTMLLVTIASISLLIGGIGIMNVMLVSVTERTREIGVRVAIGATQGAIRLQFLGESVMLSLAGGAAGVLFGIAGSFMIGRSFGWAMEMSVASIALAVLFSVAVGVCFGYYPARKASLLNPIDALRWE
jgi:putative ABC transport system permease protein